MKCTYLLPLHYLFTGFYRINTLELIRFSKCSSEEIKQRLLEYSIMTAKILFGADISKALIQSHFLPYTPILYSRIPVIFTVTSEMPVLEISSMKNTCDVCKGCAMHDPPPRYILSLCEAIWLRTPQTHPGIALPDPRVYFYPLVSGSQRRPRQI